MADGGEGNRGASGRVSWQAQLPPDSKFQRSEINVPQDLEQKRASVLARAGFLSQTYRVPSLLDLCLLRMAGATRQLQLAAKYHSYMFQRICRGTT